MPSTKPSTKTVTNSLHCSPSKFNLKIWPPLPLPLEFKDSMSYVLILECIFIHTLIPAFNHNRYQFPAFFFFQIQSWNIYFPPPPQLPIPSEFRYELYLDFRAHFIHAFNTAFNHNSHQFPAFFPSKFNLELCSPPSSSHSHSHQSLVWVISRFRSTFYPCHFDSGFINHLSHQNRVQADRIEFFLSLPRQLMYNRPTRSKIRRFSFK